MPTNSKYMCMDKMKQYVDFLHACKEKIYEDNDVLHKHHIYPKFIYGKNKDIIKLNVEDHITAHLLFASCFEEGSYEWSTNLKSARILNKKSIRDKKTLDEIASAYKGENNPFFGKTHNQEFIDLMGKLNSERTKGKTYYDLYGDRAEEEKLKRKRGVKKSHENMSEEDKKLRSNNISSALVGKKPWNIGLTKENDERVKKYSDKQSQTRTGVKKGPYKNKTI